MILTRYILKEHVGPFIFSILVLVFVFILNIVFRDLGRLLSRGIAIGTIFEFLFLNLAWILALAVPMGVLVATLTTFGRFSADNEITAIKASGISFFRMVVPVLITSLILMVLLIIYNDSVLPHFNHRARLLMSDIFRKRPTLKLEPNVVFTDIPKMNLLTKYIVERGDSSLLKDITIDDFNEKGVRRTVFAKSGKLKFDKRSDRLFLDLYEGEIHEIDKQDYSKYRKLQFERYRIKVNIPGLTLKRSESAYRGDREKTIEMMKKDIARQKKVIQERQQNLKQSIRRDLDEVFLPELLPDSVTHVAKIQSSSPLQLKLSRLQAQRIHNRLENILNHIQTEERILESYSRAIDKLRVEIHKKYSIPVACVVFVLIGAPLGILTRKGNMGVAAGISFIFYLIYWVFLIAGEELADRQLMNPIWSMWAPNVLVGGFGIYLVLYTVREYRPIQWQKIGLGRRKRDVDYEQA